MDLNTATRIIDRNFDVFDTARQNNLDKADGKISENDLKTVAENADGRFTDRQQEAAQFLLDSEASYSFLDVGAGRGRVDGTISRDDMDAALETLESGSYYDELLDTAAGRGGRDENISDRDIVAALSDPGVPQELKDAINLLLLAPEGGDDLHAALQGLDSDDVEAISMLVDSSQYGALSGSDQRLIAEAVRSGEGAATTDIREFLESARYASMGAEARTAALTEFALVNSSEFDALSTSDQRLVREALQDAGAGDLQFAETVKSLIQSGEFGGMDANAQTAALSQVNNYPDSRSVANIERLIGQGWFQGQGFEDQQRSLKLVAHLSQYDDGDRTIVENTLDRFLAPDADFKLQWNDDTGRMGPDGDGNVTYGYASGDTLTLNGNIVEADNNEVAEGSSAARVIENTTAHEVSHLVNEDSTNQTFDYLNEEYRAWYVGYLAENGEPPTNQQAMDRWEYFLNPDGGYADYSHGVEGSWGPLNIGAKDGALEKPEEAEKIFELLSELSGLDVDADNYRDVMADPDSWATDPGDHASDDVFPPDDDLDN